jgi:transposase
VQRLRHQLRDFFPAALEAFDDLDAPDMLELLAKAPDPVSAARLTTAQVSAALKRARRRDIAVKTAAIRAALGGEQLAQAPEVITALNQQITIMEKQVEAHFRQHPDAEIVMSQPGLGPILGARVLGEFGDDPRRYASGKARKNYAATSPVTRASGKRAAQRQLANRLVGILHGCLKTRTCYNDATAWPQHTSQQIKTAA